jgi:hypothetical protein
MVYHNPTCGCAECGNYGQKYNPHAIHNQSCGCSECGNYSASSTQSVDGRDGFVAESPVPPESQSVRIFSLANELGMDSKVLIQLCRTAGINVRGSALARLTFEERDAVLRLISNSGRRDRERRATTIGSPAE